MKQRLNLLLLFLGTAFLFSQPVNASNDINQIKQEVIWQTSQKDNPVFEEGLAGCFFGSFQNYLIMAGGSAFPNLKPWDGGKKSIFDQVTILTQDNNGVYKTINTDRTLIQPLAEGASASLASGVLCIGGESPQGLSRNVFQLSITNEELVIKEFPHLPIALKNASATVINSKVYLAGGEGAEGPSNLFLMLDSENIDKGWQNLPTLPQALTGASLVAQMDGEEVALYLIGGRAKTENQSITSFYSTVYHYRPSTQKWSQKLDIRPDNKSPHPLSMAVGSAVGASHILIAGGDDGTVYNQVEAAINQLIAGDENAKNQRDSLWKSHPGFYSQFLIYNTITDSWFDAGTWEGNPIAVGTGTKSDGNIYIAGGEIKPGIRSSTINKISFSVKTGFGWINYFVLVIYFGGMLLLGFFFMKKGDNTDGFFKAGGRIPWWAAGISIFATTLSAITFIAIPAKSYATDWRMLLFNLTIILIAPLVIRFFLPFFRRFNFDTAYQYLEVRFGRSVRWLAASLFILFMVSRIAIVLFLPSLALHTVTGFNIYWAIVVVGVVTIIYCTSGGVEAVIWGDVIQGFILVIGALLAFVFMIDGIEGGLGTFWNQAVKNHKFHTFDFSFNFTQPVFWVVLIGGLSNTLISYTSDQSVVQRYMTTRDEKATSRSIWLNGFLSIPVSLLFFLLGTGLYVFYISNPQNLGIENPNIDSVFPQFIISEMPLGLAGLLIAAIFAAAMSTLSSNLNSVSAVITSDFYKTIWNKPSEKNSMKVARWSGVIVGALGIGMALVLATWNIASLWDQFNTFLGLLTGGLGALFIMGIFFPRIGTIPALVGTFGGLITLIVIKNSTSISFLLYGFLGIVVTVFIALLMSLIIKNENKNFTWQSIKNNKNPI